MKKFLTGFRYGNWLTRLYVLSVPICILGGVGLVITSFILNSMIMFLVGIGFGIGAIALLQCFTIEEDGMNITVRQEQVPLEREYLAEPKTAPKKPKPPKPDKKPVTPEEEQETAPKRQKKEKKEPKKESQKESNKESKKEPKKEPKAEKEQEEKPKTVREPKKQPTEPEEQKQPDTEEPAEPEEHDVQELVSYDKKKIKQVFYKYKVRKDHKAIIIDEWKEKDVKQCPAYIWLHRGQVHMLLMGKDVRELKLSAAKAGTLTYVKGVVCKIKEEYPQFRKESLLSTVFSPYLPTYHEGMKNGRPVIYKNLFVLGSDLRVTNTSAKVIMDLLHPAFQVNDRVTWDMQHNDFYKEIYKTGILFREQVLTIKEYKKRMNEILQQFASTGIAEEEYEDTLRSLYRNKLITEEYVTYYMQYRERTDKENKKAKRATKKGKK